MSYDEADNQAGNQDAGEQVAMFVLADNPGLLVNVDDEDNQAGHVILHSDAGTKVSFAVFNGSLYVELHGREDGRVRHVIPKASPATHDDEVLAALAGA